MAWGGKQRESTPSVATDQVENVLGRTAHVRGDLKAVVRAILLDPDFRFVGIGKPGAVVRAVDVALREASDR